MKIKTITTIGIVIIIILLSIPVGLYLIVAYPPDSTFCYQALELLKILKLANPTAMCL